MSASIETITLRCVDAEATIAPERGAIVTSFRVRNRELLYLDQATFNDRSKNVRGGIPILFPSPGKLENDQWRCAGKSGEMKQHGFARTMAWAIEPSNDASKLTLSIRSNDATRLQYPWEFNAQLSVTLMPRALELHFAITNEDSSPMPFAFGLHPYFLVSDKARAKISTRATRAFDNVAKRSVNFHGFDFTQDEVDIHLLDHDGTSATLDTGAETISVQCSKEFNRWVVWSIPGKDFICLEPWTALGNALNSGEGVVTLASHERRDLSVAISV